MPFLGKEDVDQLVMFSMLKTIHFCSRHLIGFFLFLFLTIYTAMRVPAVVHLDSLQHFRDMLPVADWHKIQEQLLSCFPSMPNIPDPHRLMDVLKIKMSWPSMDFLTSLSGLAYISP